MFCFRKNTVIILCLLYIIHKGYCPLKKPANIRRPFASEITEKYYDCMKGIGEHFGDMKLTEEDDPTKLNLTNKFGITDILGHAKNALLYFNYESKMNEFAREYYESFYFSLKADSIKSVNSFCNDLPIEKDKKNCKKNLLGLFKNVKPLKKDNKSFTIKKILNKAFKVDNSMDSLATAFYFINNDSLALIGNDQLSQYFKEIIGGVQVNLEQTGVQTVFKPPNILCDDISKRFIIIKPSAGEGSSSTVV